MTKLKDSCGCGNCFICKVIKDNNLGDVECDDYTKNSKDWIAGYTVGRELMLQEVKDAIERIRGQDKESLYAVAYALLLQEIRKIEVEK